MLAGSITNIGNGSTKSGSLINSIYSPRKYREMCEGIDTYEIGEVLNEKGIVV